MRRRERVERCPGGGVRIELDDGLNALRRTLTRLTDLPVSELVDAVLAELALEPGEDDIALLAVHIERATRDSAAPVDLPEPLPNGSP